MKWTDRRSAVAALTAAATILVTITGASAATTGTSYQRFIDVGTSSPPSQTKWEPQVGFIGGAATSVPSVSTKLNKAVAKTSLVGATSFSLTVPNGRYAMTIYATPTTAPTTVTADDHSIQLSGSSPGVVTGYVIKETVKDRTLDLSFSPASNTLSIAALVVKSISLDSTATSTTTTSIPSTTTSTTVATTSTTLASTTTTTAAPTTTTSTTVPPGGGSTTTGAYPATPPAKVCGNASLLTGPATAPSGSVTVPAGNNANIDLGKASTTYWFAPGTHTLGTGAYANITAGTNSTYIGAPGAILDGQGSNRYAFVGNNTGVTVKYLTIQNFGSGSSASTPSGDNNNEGVVNHDAGHSWTIANNTVQGVAGAGVFIGSGDVVKDNCLTRNGQYGFSAYEETDVNNVVLDHNEVSFNDTYDWEAKVDGCGCTGGGKFWATHGAVVTNNYLHDNYSVGIWADTNNNGFDIAGNYISNNYGSGIIYETSYNALMKNNTFIANAIHDGPMDSGFPNSAIYISESGSDARVAGAYGQSFDITGNLFQDNWGGVILWENADRYCSSSANTSTGDCTMVNPSVANITTCASSTKITQKPYIDDCRWKTQNVKVSNNTFISHPANISPKCTKAALCGYNGIFSQWGSFAPFTGTVVEDHIAYNQGNAFSSNTYLGSWYFMAHEQGTTVSLSQWQSAPYGQDLGSKAS